MYMDEVMKEAKMEMGMMESRFLEERREWRLPGLLCREGEDPRAMVGLVGRFVVVCKRRSLKVNQIRVR